MIVFLASNKGACPKATAWIFPADVLCFFLSCSSYSKGSTNKAVRKKQGRHPDITKAVKIDWRDLGGLYSEPEMNTNTAGSPNKEAVLL